MWLEMLLLCEGGEGGAIVPQDLPTNANAIVPDGWHSTAAALAEFTSIFLPRSNYQDIKQTTDSLFPWLQGKADALQGIAIMM
jgi:hypothetical protein